MYMDFKQIGYDINHRNYRFIGSGSGRRVFDLGNGYVVKVAFNKKGIAQNNLEAIISFFEDCPLLAKVIQVSEDNKFLVMEKATKIRTIHSIWEYYEVNSQKELLYIPQLREVIDKYYLLEADLYRSSSWGMIDGRPVVIDYGFSYDIRERYYRRH